MGTLNPAVSHPTALSESPSTPSLLLPAQLGLLSANPAPQKHTARCTKRAFLPPGTQREWTFALENEATKALAQAEKCMASLQSHVNGACAQNTKGGEEAEPLGREKQPVQGAPRDPCSLTSPLCTPNAACTPARPQHLLALRDCSPTVIQVIPNGAGTAVWWPWACPWHPEMQRTPEQPRLCLSAGKQSSIVLQQKCSEAPGSQPPGPEILSARTVLTLPST